MASGGILAAILDFSKCSRLFSWYPPDIISRGHEYVESSEKKTFMIILDVLDRFLDKGTTL